MVKWLDEVPEGNDEKKGRKFSHYSMANILMQGLFLFLCQGESRNQMNNRARFGDFMKENFCRLFPGMHWAHFDTVDVVLQGITMERLEEVKNRMLREMIKKKRISTTYGYYTIAVDATGVTTYDQNPGGNLLRRKSSSGRRQYLNYILEAKIVTAEGLSLSICSEPLTNKHRTIYDKQDCELKAFIRLAAKLHKAFPRLPICLLMDGLYPNQTVFECCKLYGWEYIITLKDGNLPNLQEAISDTEERLRKRYTRVVVVNKGQKEKKYGTAKYQWIEGLEHKGYKLNYLECFWPGVALEDGTEVPATRFGYVTSLTPRHQGLCHDQVIFKMAEFGRWRWKIENQGFNTQKNQGYHLQHKFKRRAVPTLHVYYMLLQIAHLINQVVIHSQEVAALLRASPKLTHKFLWEKMRSVLDMCRLSTDRLAENERRCQIRLE